jgi:hypothetical protein
MLTRFMATDRAFAKTRRVRHQLGNAWEPISFAMKSNESLFCRNAEVNFAGDEDDVVLRNTALDNRRLSVFAADRALTLLRPYARSWAWQVNSPLGSNPHSTESVRLRHRTFPMQPLLAARQHQPVDFRQ